MQACGCDHPTPALPLTPLTPHQENPSQRLLSHPPLLTGPDLGRGAVMGPCAGLAGAEQAGSCWEPWSRAKCHDALQPKPVLHAQCSDWATCHTHVLGTHLVWAHSLQSQGPLPIQRVGRGRRTGAPGPWCGGEAEPVQQRVEPLVPGTNHTWVRASPEEAAELQAACTCPTRPADQSWPTLHKPWCQVRPVSLPGPQPRPVSISAITLTPTHCDRQRVA